MSFFQGVGKKFLLLLAICVTYTGIAAVCFLIELLTGVNPLAEPVRVGSKSVDAIPVIGVLGAPLAAWLYFKFAKRMTEKAGWDDSPPL